MWLHSIVPFSTASRTCKGGTISPAACILIWNFPAVICATRRVINSAVPKRVSTLFGKLEAQRQRTFSVCARAAGAKIAALPPMTKAPLLDKNSRRLMINPHV